MACASRNAQIRAAISTPRPVRSPISRRSLSKAIAAPSSPGRFLTTTVSTRRHASAWRFANDDRERRLRRARDGREPTTLSRSLSVPIQRSTSFTGGTVGICERPSTTAATRSPSRPTRAMKFSSAGEGVPRPFRRAGSVWSSSISPCWTPSSHARYNARLSPLAMSVRSAINDDSQPCPSFRHRSRPSRQTWQRRRHPRLSNEHPATVLARG